VCIVISASLQACGVVFPFATFTSICRSIVTICSGLYLLIGMASFSSKWILSHSTWYKNRRSRQRHTSVFYRDRRLDVANQTRASGGGRKMFLTSPYIDLTNHGIQLAGPRCSSVVNGRITAKPEVTVVTRPFHSLKPRS